MLSTTLDPAVLAVLPPGCEVVDVYQHGTASWSSGYKVDVEVGDEEKEYFLKVIQRPNHFEMARGEYESQKAMAELLPENVAIPLGYGTFELDPSKSFFLTPFRELKDKVPDPVQLTKVLEKLHQSSVSPTGKFGFHVQTFNGVVPLINDWTDTWEEYFTRQFRSDIAWQQDIAGPDPEFNKVAEEFFEKVIPRLLRPLETGGRSIKPTLVHGDIWHGNCQIDSTTQQVILFDSCCCYAHNELELHMMRDPRYQFSEKHMQTYRSVVGTSAPVADFDDRNALYAMRDQIINAGLHEHRRFLRDRVKEEMIRLLEKHPDGLDGFKEPDSSFNTQAFGLDQSAQVNQATPVVAAPSTASPATTKQESEALVTA